MGKKAVRPEVDASAQRFDSLFALSSDIYWEQDTEYRFTRFLGADKAMVEALSQAQLGKRRWDLQYLNMDEAAWAAHRATLDARKTFRDLELSRLDEAGRVVWVSISGEAAFDDAGRFIGYRGLGKHITARKRAQALTELEHSIARALAAAPQTGAGVRSVIQAICQLEGWPVGRYFEVDEVAGVLRFAEAWGTDDPLAQEYIRKSHGLVYRRGEGLSGHAWLTGEAVWVADVSRDPRASGSGQVSPKLKMDLRRGALIIPVKIENRTVGVLSFASSRVREPDERLLRSLTAIGDQVGQFVERKQVEVALAESEARFRQTFELAASGIAQVSLEGRFVHVNRRLCAILGYGEQELLGRSVKEISHPDDRDVTDAERALLRRGHLERTSFEKRYLRKDGSVVWVNLTVAVVHDLNGEPQYEISVVEDISERKSADARLRRFRAGLDAAADMVFLIDPGDARILDFNDAVCRTLGYAREELLGAPFTRVRPDRAPSLLAADLQSLCREPDSDEVLDTVFRHKDGTLLPVESIRRVIRTADGAIVVVTSRDLRERKAAERALRESEERFRSLTKLSSDWYWEQDAELRFIKFEGRGGGEGGYDPSAAVLGKRVWEDPGIDASSADWEAHRAALERREAFRDFEYSYTDREGNRFFVSASGEPVFDEEGRFKGYRGTARDITRRRRDDEALRRFRAAMDMSSDAIFLTDRATMRFVDVNRAACIAVGMSRARILAAGPGLFGMSKEHVECVFDEVIARSPEGAREERTYTAADGKERWVELHRRALRAGDSWIIVTIGRDVTDRKQAEQRRARHLRRQERIARFGQEALAKRDAAELILSAVQTVLEALRAEAVAYFERSPKNGETIMRVLVGLPGEHNCPCVVRLGDASPASSALRGGGPLFTTGRELDLDWARTFGSVALIPLQGQAGVRGALCVAQREHDRFGREALKFMEAIATILSTALQRLDSEARLSYLAQFDSLTGLPNRALLADRFGQAIVQAERRNNGLGALFVDLDDFKMVNDTLGHAAGDDLLKGVAGRLQAAVRSGDTVARIAGDEFALLLADLASPDHAALVAQKLICALAEPFLVQGQEVVVSASIGIATYPADAQDGEALLAAADAVMYRAKQLGRNGYQFFTSDLDSRIRARAQMTAELRHALERGEFELHYQPKFDLDTRSVCGAEALLRWKRAGSAYVSPAEFIPLLEESGLIVPVGEWVLRTACEHLRARSAAGAAALPVAVNVSARQFRQPDLLARLAAIIEAAGVDASLIELEITESQLMQDPEHAVRLLQEMRRAGIGLALDDFGTGYSSLAYLTRFPLSSLKIDRSFVANALTQDAAASIVRTTIDMAHTLGFIVVAEGVETEAQAAFLRGLRCDQGQGYWFARPMPEQALVAFLQQATAGLRMPAERRGARASR